jgi:hypothetical protein
MDPLFIDLKLLGEVGKMPSRILVEIGQLATREINSPSASTRPWEDNILSPWVPLVSS